jgi:hypothetical protein
LTRSKRKMERKWVPLVMSTGLIASALLAAGVPASAQALDNTTSKVTTSASDNTSKTASNVDGDSAAKATTHAGDDTTMKTASNVDEDSAVKATTNAGDDTTTKMESNVDRDSATNQVNNSDDPSGEKESSDERQGKWVDNTYRVIVSDYETLINDYHKYVENWLYSNQKTANKAEAANSISQTTEAVTDTAAKPVTSVGDTASKTVGTVTDTATKPATSVGGDTVSQNTANVGNAADSSNPIFDKFTGYFNKILAGYQSLVSHLK